MNKSNDYLQLRKRYAWDQKADTSKRAGRYLIVRQTLPAGTSSEEHRILIEEINFEVELMRDEDPIPHSRISVFQCDHIPRMVFSKD